MKEDRNKRKVTISSQEQVTKEENRILRQIFAVKTPEAVEAALSFAGYIRGFGLDAENYPLFLRLLDIENHWVTDALVGSGDPFEFFDTIPSNNYLIAQTFKILSNRYSGGVYSKTLGALLSIVKKAYTDSRNGYKIYPLTIADVDNLGKHLDTTGGQDEPYNRLILEILEKINKLEGVQQASMMDIVAKQAGKIRNTFFDNRKTLDSAIPESLTIVGNYRDSEVHPKKLYRN